MQRTTHVPSNTLVRLDIVQQSYPWEGKYAPTYQFLPKVLKSKAGDGNGETAKTEDKEKL